MNKTISVATILIFLTSIYILPSLSAITLGEIRPEKYEDSSEVKDPVPDTGVRKPMQEKPAEKLAETKNEDTDEVNPRLVCLLSVIMPGGGHFYLNNDIKGIGFCLAAGIGYTATGYFMVKTMLADIGSTAFKNYILLTSFLFFVTIVVHFVGIIEAYSDADELNKEKLFGNGENNPNITVFVVQ
jgi:hypothetical protein